MKAYIIIDDARPVYPVFYLSKANDASAVPVPATKELIQKWKTAFVAYRAAQDEMERLVNHYEPAKIKPERKQSTE